MEKLLRVGLLLPKSLWHQLAIVASHEGMSRANFVRRKLDAAVAGKYGALPMPPIMRPGRPKRDVTDRVAPPIWDRAPPMIEDELPVIGEDDGVPTQPPVARVEPQAEETEAATEDNGIVGGYKYIDGDWQLRESAEIPASQVQSASPEEVPPPGLVSAAVVGAPAGLNGAAVGREPLGPVRVVGGIEYAPLPDPVFVELYGEAGAYVRYNAALVDDGWEPISVDEYRADLLAAGEG